jgi:hypothetical protein
MYVCLAHEMCVNSDMLGDIQTFHTQLCGAQMAEIQEELEKIRAAHDMALAREKELQAHLNEARRRAEEFENQVLHARKEVKVGLVVCVYCVTGVCLATE